MTSVSILAKIFTCKKECSVEEIIILSDRRDGSRARIIYRPGCMVYELLRNRDQPPRHKHKIKKLL